MSPKGRPPKDDLARTGHRAAVGQGKPAETPPVDQRIVAAKAHPDMSPLAGEIYEMCVEDLAALGHLRRVDLLRIRDYAVESALCIEYEATINEFGAMMKEPIIVTDMATGEDIIAGYKLKVNPACKAHREHSNAVRLIASELALTPMARIRGNLMQAATASIALGIKDEIDAELAAEDAAVAAERAVARKKPVKKTVKPAKKKTATKKKPAAGK